MENSPVYFVEETDSTNHLLKDIVEKAGYTGSRADEFFAVQAAFQNAGRGLHKNAWQSNKGENLLVSIYFTPPILPAQQFLFNRFFTLSVRATLAKYLDHVWIKWSNDIYVNDRKIAGILIEHTIAGDKILHTIAGVGININQTDFDPAVANPTSFKLEIGKEFNISVILSELLENCRSYYSYLIDSRHHFLEEEYLRYLYRIGEWKKYLVQGEEIEAKITGVDSYGRLVLESVSGKQYECNLKEVRFL